MTRPSGFLHAWLSTGLVMAIALVGSSCSGPEPARAVSETRDAVFTPRSHAHVFFVGHSLVNFEMPKNLEVMAKSLGLELEWDAQIIDGASLEHHVRRPEDTRSMRVDEAMRSGFFDTVVIAEAVPIMDMLRHRRSQEHLADLAAMARNGNPDIRVFLNEVWMHRDRPRGSPFMKRLDWRAFLDEDLPQWERLAEGASRRAGGIPIAMIPAGRAIGMLVDAVNDGLVPGVRSEDDLFEDHVHLTPIGNHFVAAVVLAAVYQRDPSGASGEIVDERGRRITSLPRPTREALYRIAWRGVSTYPRACTPRPIDAVSWRD
jgi:hypothetical protein